MYSVMHSPEVAESQVMEAMVLEKEVVVLVVESV